MAPSAAGGPGTASEWRPAAGRSDGPACSAALPRSGCRGAELDAGDCCASGDCVGEMLTGSTAAAGLGGDCTGEGPLWEPEAAGFSAEAWVGAGPLWEADEAGFWGEAMRRKAEGWGREGSRWEAEAASRWAGAWDRERPLREPGAARAWAAGRVEVSGSRGRPSRRRFLWLCVSSGASGAPCP